MYVFGFLLLISSFIQVENYQKRFIVPYKNDRNSFKKFTENFEKEYKNEHEYTKRYESYKKNIDFINKHNNNEKKGFTLRENQFTDEDIKSLKKKLFSYEIQRDAIEPVYEKNNFKIDGFTLSKERDSDLILPESLDYRELNAVTDVKNQKRCGSCWAFSAVGALESKHALTSGELVRFSEQKMVDCSTSNHACNGGLMHLAYDDLMWQFSLPLEDDYP